MKESCCHPEAGEARRGTPQTLKRFRETDGVYVSKRWMVAGRQSLQLRGPSPSSRLGMTPHSNPPQTSRFVFFSSVTSPMTIVLSTALHMS